MGTITTSIVVLFILFTGFFFLLRLKDKRNLKKLRKNYDEKENPSRRTGEGRQTGYRTREPEESVGARARAREPEESVGGIKTRPSESEHGRLLPTATSGVSGEDGIRKELPKSELVKDSRSIGRPERFHGIIRKLRRKGRA